MATWPSTLPQSVEVNGYSEKPAPVVLRSQMDAGPAKQRRRSTAGAAPVQCTVTLDSTQYDTFKSFYDEDIGGGALSFDWVHPVTQAAATLRFSGGQYEIRALAPDRFQLAMTLEIMP